MKRRRIIYVVLTLFALVTAALPQTATSNVKGHVLDRNNASIPSAIVWLKSTKTGDRKQVVSSGEGAFTFTDVIPGRYIVSAEAQGYAKAEMIIEVKVGDSLTLAIILNARDAKAATAVAAGPQTRTAAVMTDDEEKDPRVVKVFYATNRMPIGDAQTAPYYASKRAQGNLSYGVCEVNIPRDHRMAEIERPVIFRFNREDPKKHVMILRVDPRESKQFYEELSARVAGGKKKEAFVFIHGYSNSFEVAARRTAQLAYDLGFDGAPICFSWPSLGKLSGYMADEATAEWAITHLKKFLEELARESGAEKIHLIAHSMGNRLLTNALNALASEQKVTAASLFREIILAAPDVDLDVFEQLVPALSQPGRRVTIYASSEDRVIKISTRLHGNQRAGQSGPITAVINGMDTIDVTALDTGLGGHWYYGDNKSVITDMIRLIRYGKTPAERCGIVFKFRTNVGQYYAFSPEKAHTSDPRCEPIK